MTPVEVRVRIADRPALLEWVPFLIVNNCSKLEVNIFSNERNITKRLISSDSKSKKGHNCVKNILRVTCL